jgi:hypothetical protein
MNLLLGPEIWSTGWKSWELISGFHKAFAKTQFVANRSWATQGPTVFISTSLSLSPATYLFTSSSIISYSKTFHQQFNHYYREYHSHILLAIVTRRKQQKEMILHHHLGSDVLANL